MLVWGILHNLPSLNEGMPPPLRREAEEEQVEKENDGALKYTALLVQLTMTN